MRQYVKRLLAVGVIVGVAVAMLGAYTTLRNARIILSTIDSSPIGGAVPSTGAFTSLAASTATVNNFPVSTYTGSLTAGHVARFYNGSGVLYDAGDTQKITNFVLTSCAASGDYSNWGYCTATYYWPTSLPNASYVVNCSRYQNNVAHRAPVVVETSYQTAVYWQYTMFAMGDDRGTTFALNCTLAQQ